jgi:hypothetical protein
MTCFENISLWWAGVFSTSRLDSSPVFLNVSELSGTHYRPDFVKPSASSGVSPVVENSLLFFIRKIDLIGFEPVKEWAIKHDQQYPPPVFVYAIHSVFFFGVAERAP